MVRNGSSGLDGDVRVCTLARCTLSPSSHVLFPELVLFIHLAPIWFPPHCKKRERWFVFGWWMQNCSVGWRHSSKEMGSELSHDSITVEHADLWFILVLVFTERSLLGAPFSKGERIDSYVLLYRARSAHTSLLPFIDLLLRYHISAHTTQYTKTFARSFVPCWDTSSVQMNRFWLASMNNTFWARPTSNDTTLHITRSRFAPSQNSEVQITSLVVPGGLLLVHSEHERRGARMSTFAAVNCHDWNGALMAGWDEASCGWGRLMNTMW